MANTSKCFVLILVALFLISLVTFQPPSVKAQSKTIVVPDDYPTIQAAVNSAASGDTIFVRNGYYYEHVTIAEPLTLLGQNKYQTVIDGNSTGNVLSISASNVTVNGFTIQRSSANGGSGIYLGDASLGSNVSGNIILYNGRGICVNSSSNNIISGNTVSSCASNGISLIQSVNNVVSGNSVTGNTQGSGVLLYGSSFNTISNNTLNNNSDGIEFSSSDGTSYGIYSSNNTVSGNIVESNSFIGVAFWYSSNNFIAGNKVNSNSFYGMYICASTGATIFNNSVTGNGNDAGRAGIDIYGSFNCTVYQNKILNNPFGGLNVDYGSEDNAIFENNIANNGVGIFIFNYAKNNIFYHNNVVSNTQQVSSDVSQNVWDNGYASGGNYWSDYTGIDANADGLGDTPYVINSVNKDNFPFMNPVTIVNPVIIAPTPTPTPKLETTVSATTDNGSIVILTFKGNVSVDQIFNLTVATNQSAKITIISFTVTGENGTTGFSNITIPMSEMSYGTTPTIYIDNQPAEGQGYTQDSNNYYVWYTTHFSTHQVSVVFAPTTPTPASSSDSQNTVSTGLDWVQLAILILMGIVAVAVVAVAFVFLSKKRTTKQTEPA